MQERHFAALPDSAHHFHHQRSGITLSSVLRMCAHGTDFGVAGDLQPFAGHRHQLSLMANSKVRPQFMGAIGKGTGLGKGGEFNHFGRVCGRQFDDGRGGLSLRRDTGTAVFANHLQQWRVRDQVPARTGLVRSIEEESDCPTSAEQTCQRFVSPVGWLLKGSQGGYIAGKPAGVEEGLGEVRLPCGERFPDDVIEKMH